MWVRGNLHVGSHRPLSGMAQRAQTRSKQRSPQPQRKPWAVGQPLGHYAPPHLSSTYSGRSPGLPEDACSLSVCVFVVCFGANKITRVLWKLPHGARHGSTLDPPLCGTQRPLQAEVSATRQHALIEDIGFLEGGGGTEFARGTPRFQVQLQRYVPDIGVHPSLGRSMYTTIQTMLESFMCARWLGGELHVEVCVLGHSAADLLERWSFDIRSSPMSHPAMNCMSADRAYCVRGVGEDGVTRACRGAEIRGGELVTCMSLLHP